MDGTIIGYLRISGNPLMWPQGAGTICTQFGPKKCLFLLNFTKIIRFFLDLGLKLFDIPKDVSSILGFATVNWVPKWTKTVNFGCVLFDSKFELYKDFSNTVCLIGRLPLVKISARSNNILGTKAQNP